MMLVNRSEEEFLLLKTDMLMEPRSDLFVMEQVNARGMGITTTIYKRNAAMCSI